MVVQASRGATFSDVDEAAGIVWAVDHGARIVNLSLSGSQTSATERAAVRYATKKGVLLVAAAGNGGQSGNRASYPAALLGRDGLVVGASTPTGTRATFSTTGRYVDLLAPGVGVLGAIAASAPNTLFAPAPGTAGYGLGSGTSYSAPEVAGAAALVWAANPLLNASSVASILTSTASGHGVWSTELGFGTLDAGRGRDEGARVDAQRASALEATTLDAFDACAERAEALVDALVALVDLVRVADRSTSPRRRAPRSPSPCRRGCRGSTCAGRRAATAR